MFTEHSDEGEWKSLRINIRTIVIEMRKAALQQNSIKHRCPINDV